MIRISPKDVPEQPLGSCIGVPMIRICFDGLRKEQKKESQFRPSSSIKNWSNNRLYSGYQLRESQMKKSIY
jgi:hypothetical protein